MSNARTELLQAFLTSHGWEERHRSVLADDASFRRYDRLQDGWRRAVLMDAPPDKEDVRPFCEIASQLAKLDLSAPEIIAEDAENGFLLIEDLGDDTFTRMLDMGADEATLYAQALEALITVQRRFDVQTADAELPLYTDQLLLNEVSLFLDWYMPAVGLDDLSDEMRGSFLSQWRDLLDQARQVPDTLVLRDFHVDNLIWLPDRESPRSVGLLDFQDAVIGPVTYDLVSLLEDARRDVSPDVQARLLDRFEKAFPQIEPEALKMSYAILGAQRGLKILGIFTRLDRRDGKPGYLRHIDRVWRWIEGDMSHPSLGPLKGWLDQHCPKSARRTPMVQSNPNAGD